MTTTTAAMVHGSHLRDFLDLSAAVLLFGAFGFSGEETVLSVGSDASEDGSTDVCASVSDGCTGCPQEGQTPLLSSNSAAEISLPHKLHFIGTGHTFLYNPFCRKSAYQAIIADICGKG